MKKLTLTWRQQKVTRSRDSSFSKPPSSSPLQHAGKAGSTGSEGSGGVVPMVTSPTLRSSGGRRKRLGQHIPRQQSIPTITTNPPHGSTDGSRREETSNGTEDNDGEEVVATKRTSKVLGTSTQVKRQSPRLKKVRQTSIRQQNAELNSSFQSTFSGDLDLDDDVLQALERAEEDYNRVHGHGVTGNKENCAPGQSQPRRGMASASEKNSTDIKQHKAEAGKCRSVRKDACNISQTLPDEIGDRTLLMLTESRGCVERQVKGTNQSISHRSRGKSGRDGSLNAGDVGVKPPRDSVQYTSIVPQGSRKCIPSNLHVKENGVQEKRGPSNAVGENKNSLSAASSRESCEELSKGKQRMWNSDTNPFRSLCVTGQSGLGKSPHPAASSSSRTAPLVSGGESLTLQHGGTNSAFLVSILDAESDTLSAANTSGPPAAVVVFCEDSQSQAQDDSVPYHVSARHPPVQQPIQKKRSPIMPPPSTTPCPPFSTPPPSTGTTTRPSHHTPAHKGRSSMSPPASLSTIPCLTPTTSTTNRQAPNYKAPKSNIMPPPTNTTNNLAHKYKQAPAVDQTPARTSAQTQVQTPSRTPAHTRAQTPAHKATKRSPVTPPPPTSPPHDRLLLSSWGLPEAVLAQYQRAGITRMFPWQVECLQAGRVLEGGNLVYAAPTSAGKTLVAELLVLKKVLETKKKALIILPFVSVSREKMFYLQSMFSDAGVRVDGFMGSHSPPGGLAGTDIAICTIEKANSLVNRLLEEKKIGQLGIVVVDELHMIGDSHRGYLLELLLTKIKYVTATTLRSAQEDGAGSQRNNPIQVIGMSATLPNLDLLASWLDAQLYRTDFRPVPLSEHVKIGKALYDSSMKKLRDVQPQVEVKGDEDQVFALCLETISRGNGVLVFCPTKNWCEKLCEMMAREIYRMHQGAAAANNTGGFVKASSMLPVKLDHASLRDVVEQLRRTPVSINSVLRKTIPYGVAYHHAGLTFDERDIIEGAFRQGAVKILVATSTLSSGVNLPARRVIIRSIMFNRKVIDPLTYKQMIGRAGRKGVDTEGESVLVCKTSEREKASKLMRSELPAVQSCLIKRQDDDLSNSLKRAILEIIASGVASSPSEVHAYASSTLLAASLTEVAAGVTGSKVDTQSAVLSCVKFLEENEFIRLQNVEVEGVTVEKYCPTQLGKATLSSALSPDEALLVFAELQKARKNFVLENELHILYQVTPIYNQGFQPDWYQFVCAWEAMSSDQRRVAELVGVEEAFLMRASQGLVTYSSRSARVQRSIAVHRRFYTTLILRELVNEVPLPTVAARYNCAFGQLQSLQQSASTFAGMVTVFCNRLGWWNLELLLAQFQSRLGFGIQRELCDLVRVSLLDARRARLLYDRGLQTLAALAACDPAEVENTLRNAVPFKSGRQAEGEDAYEAVERRQTRCIWATGRKGLTEAEAAKLIVSEARHIVQAELGIANVAWQKDDKGRDESEVDMSIDRTAPGGEDGIGGRDGGGGNLGKIGGRIGSEELENKADKGNVQGMVKELIDNRNSVLVVTNVSRKNNGHVQSTEDQITTDSIGKREITEKRRNMQMKLIKSPECELHLQFIQASPGKSSAIDLVGQCKGQGEEVSGGHTLAKGNGESSAGLDVRQNDHLQGRTQRNLRKNQIAVVADVHEQPDTARGNAFARSCDGNLKAVKGSGEGAENVISKQESASPAVSVNTLQCKGNRTDSLTETPDVRVDPLEHQVDVIAVPCLGSNMPSDSSTPIGDIGTETRGDTKEKNTSPELFSCPLSEGDPGRALAHMAAQETSPSSPGAGQGQSVSPAGGVQSLEGNPGQAVAGEGQGEDTGSGNDEEISPTFPSMDSQLEQYMAEYCTQNDLVAESASPELPVGRSRRRTANQQDALDVVSTTDSNSANDEVEGGDGDDAIALFGSPGSAIRTGSGATEQGQVGAEDVGAVAAGPSTEVESTQDLLLAAAMCESFDSFSTTIDTSLAAQNLSQNMELSILVNTQNHGNLVHSRPANHIGDVNPSAQSEQAKSKSGLAATMQSLDDESFSLMEIPSEYETLDPNLENATVIFVGSRNKMQGKGCSRKDNKARDDVSVNKIKESASTCVEQECNEGTIGKHTSGKAAQGNHTSSHNATISNTIDKGRVKASPALKRKQKSTRKSQIGGPTTVGSFASPSHSDRETAQRDGSSLLSPGTVAMLDFLAGEDDLDMFTQLKETPHSDEHQRAALDSKKNQGLCRGTKESKKSSQVKKMDVGKNLSKKSAGGEVAILEKDVAGESAIGNTTAARGEGNMQGTMKPTKRKQDFRDDEVAPPTKQKTPPKGTSKGNGGDQPERKPSESGDFIPPTPPQTRQHTPKICKASGTRRRNGLKDTSAATQRHKGKQQETPKASSKTPKRISPRLSSKTKRIIATQESSHKSQDTAKSVISKKLQGHTKDDEGHLAITDGVSVSTNQKISPQGRNGRVPEPVSRQPSLNSEMLMQEDEDRDLFSSPLLVDSQSALNVAMDEMDLDLKLSLDSQTDVPMSPTPVKEDGITKKTNHIGLQRSITSSSLTPSFFPESFSNTPVIPSSDGAFTIIDVCADTDLFDTFIAEWKRKKRYSVSVACDRYQAPVSGGGIGGQFRKPAGGRKPAAVEPDGFPIVDLGLLVTGLAVCWGGKDTYFISLQKDITKGSPDDTLAPPDNAPGLSVRDRLVKIKQVLEIARLGRTATANPQHKVVFGAKLQYKLMSQACGCLLDGSLEDPKIAQWLIDPGSKEPNLQSLVTQYLPTETHLLEGLAGGLGLRGPGASPDMGETSRLRAATEAVLALQIMDGMKGQLEELDLWKTFMEIEMPSIVTLARVELNGLGLDVKECETQKAIMQAKLRSLEEEAYKMAGHSFSLTSTEDVAQVIYCELRLPPNGDPSAISTAPTRRTLGARGRPCLPKQCSTSKEALEKLRPLHPLPGVVLEFRRISAAVAKVVCPLQKEVVHNGRLDMDRIHTVYQTHTATGRVATCEPNIQAIPKEFDIDMPSVIGESPPPGGAIPVTAHRGKGGGAYTPLLKSTATKEPGPKFAVSIRRVFCPFKGGVMLAADYSQLELRLLAHLAQDKGLIGILNSGGDVFKQIAAQWRHVDVKDVSAEQRQQAKQICYGMVYGIGARALSEQLGVCEEDAAAFMESFKAQYKGMKTYPLEVVKRCRETGYVQTLTGRRRYLPSIHHSSSAGARAQAERQAVNTTVQGSAADLVKTAMVKIDRRLAAEFPATRCSHRHRDEEQLGLTSRRRKSRRLQQALPSSTHPPSGAFLVLQLHDELIYEVRREDVGQVARLIKAEMEGAIQLAVRLPVKVKVGPSWGSLVDMDL